MCRDLVIRSRVVCPRATLSRISSAGLVQTKGSGLSFQWETQQSNRVSGLTTEVKLVLVKALRLSTENQHSTTLIHDELVGVKCRCQRRRFLWTSQLQTGWLL